MEILNQKTLKVLQSLNAIHNSAIISYPKTCVREGKSIQAYIDLEKMGEKENFGEFGIYDLSSFLSSISLIDNPVITKDNDVINIKNTRSSVNYRTSNIDVLEEVCRGDYSVIDRVRTNEKIGEFELTIDDFKQIKVASNTLKDLPDIHIFSTKNGIGLKILGKEKSSNTYEIYVDGSYEEDISLVATLSLLKKLPNSNYNVEIFKHKKNNSKILLFSSKDVDGLEILLGVQQKDIN